MGETAIIAFNNLELIFLLIGLTVSSTIYDLVLSPMAMSFITLLIVFKIIMFVIESAEMKMANSDLINGQFYLKLVFFIFIARLLLRKTDLHIKTVKSVVNEEALDRNEKVNTFVPKDTEYTLESTGLFSFGKTGVEMFGDSWFSINQPHSEVLEGTPLMDSKYTDGGVYTVKLPIFIIFPIVLVDTILYGNDGTLNSESPGVIPSIFGKYYAYLIHNPGRIFHLVYDNSKSSVERQRGNMYTGYTAYRTTMMDGIHFINKSAEDIIQVYNNFPLYMYLDIRTGEKDRAKKDWRYNETSKQMEKIFSILNDYNEELTAKLKDGIGKNTEKYYLLPFSSFANNHSGSSKSIPPVYPNDDYDVSNNKAEDRYPTWKSTSASDLISSEYYMAGKITILQLEPKEGISDEEKFLSELKNAYTSVTKQNIPLNKRDNPYDDVVLNRGFYKESDVNSIGISNYYKKYTIMFNLYEDFASKLPGGGDALVKKNPFDLLVEDFKSIEKNIYVPKKNTILQIPSFASEAVKKQKQEAEKYNPNGSSIEKSIELKKHYLEYQRDAYFKYYFVEPINFNGGQYYNNLESAYYSDRAPSMFHLWKAYQNFYNEMGNIFPKNMRITSMPYYKKLTGPIPSGGAMNASKPQKYIMKVQEQAAVKNDAIIEEFRNKHYTNARDVSLKMINLKINKLWATKTKNLGQDEIPADESTMEGNFSKKDIQLDLPILGDVGGTVLKFIIDVLGYLFAIILDYIFLGITYLFRVLYSLVYSLHSLGILITLVTFPLLFIKAMMTQSFMGLIKPFLTYLSYRMWDFALLLVIMIVLMVTPVILKFFFAFPDFIAIFLEILYVIGIFILTSTFVDLMTKLVGGEAAFSGMFNTVGSGVGKTAAMSGIAAGATATGAVTLRAARGGKLAGGSAVDTASFFKANGLSGGLQKIGGNVKSAVGGASFKGALNGIGNTAGNVKKFSASAIRDYSRFQNEGGVTGAVFNKGNPFKQFDNSQERTVGSGMKNFFSTEGFGNSSSKQISDGDLKVGGKGATSNKNVGGENSQLNNNETIEQQNGDKKESRKNLVKKLNKKRNNSNEESDFVPDEPSPSSSLLGKENGVGTSGIYPKKIPTGKEQTFAGNSSYAGTPNTTTTPSNVNGGNVKANNVDVKDINTNGVNSGNQGNVAKEIADEIKKAIKPEERPNNIVTELGKVKDSGLNDLRKIGNEVTGGNAFSRPETKSNNNSNNGNENTKTSEKTTIQEKIKTNVQQAVDTAKKDLNQNNGSKENYENLINRITKRLEGNGSSGKVASSSNEIKTMLNNNTDVKVRISEIPKNSGINIENLINNISNNISSKQ